MREISAQQAIEVSSSVLAVRQGRPDAALLHVSNAENLGMRGPFPLQSPSWARAEYAAYRGDSDGAAELLWTESQRLWNSGAKFAGALALLDSIEFAPSTQRLSYARTQLESVETPYLGAYYDYLAFLQKEDFSYTAHIAQNLQATMHTGLAIKSYQAAVEHFDSRGDENSASSFESAIAELKQKHPHVSTGYSENGLRPNLTKRELQIARLVAFGRSNQDIAKELTLSIRTIETYVHRIMKKTNSKNRMQVADHL
ncbi:response regulator transcription factor [Leucobacter viscericola]|uniref:Response regulator transcription factor n=1 Tax=Leucobacter viscericola TaxID=2714935 RepID=A0A6G7XDL1_9MICO|nr:LuxR C-terminal-related transcriptional regulator [Leucobacter viscericola]QIK62655.1 response regulator transcription factor [Leucobacter viscericola]